LDGFRGQELREGEFEGWEAHIGGATIDEAWWGSDESEEREAVAEIKQEKE
jgi:hypothetical protein